MSPSLCQQDGDRKGKALVQRDLLVQAFVSVIYCTSGMLDYPRCVRVCVRVSVCVHRCIGHKQRLRGDKCAPGCVVRARLPTRVIGRQVLLATVVGVVSLVVHDESVVHEVEAVRACLIGTLHHLTNCKTRRKKTY